MNATVHVEQKTNRFSRAVKFSGVTLSLLNTFTKEEFRGYGFVKKTINLDDNGAPQALVNFLPEDLGAVNIVGVGTNNVFELTKGEMVVEDIFEIPAGVDVKYALLMFDDGINKQYLHFLRTDW